MQENVRHDDFSRIRSGNSPAKGIVILNLMPKKIETRKSLYAAIELIAGRYSTTAIDAYEFANTPAEHLNNFYCNFDDNLRSEL